MGGGNVGWIGGCDTTLSTYENVKCDIVSANDLNRTLEWQEINGVRRVTKITMKSASVNLAHGLDPNARIERVFTYQVAYPFDLVSIIDTLLLS
jgi:hypothetical protein